MRAASVPLPPSHTPASPKLYPAYLTGKSGTPKIFRASQVTFISSLVYKLSVKTSICGMTLKGRGYAKNSFLTGSPLTKLAMPAFNSSIPCG